MDITSRSAVLFPIVRQGDGKKLISNEPVPAVILKESKGYMQVCFPYDTAQPQVNVRTVRSAHWTEKIPANHIASDYADELQRAEVMRRKFFAEVR